MKFCYLIIILFKLNFKFHLIKLNIFLILKQKFNLSLKLLNLLKSNYDNN